MNSVELVGIIGALAWLPGLWGIWEAVKRHRAEEDKVLDEGDRLVVKSALELLEPYTKRVQELQRQLGEAEETIRVMGVQLKHARDQVVELTGKLADAQSEIHFLDTQVKTLRQQMTA